MAVGASNRANDAAPSDGCKAWDGPGCADRDVAVGSGEGWISRGSEVDAVGETPGAGEGGVVAFDLVVRRVLVLDVRGPGVG